MGDVSPEEWKAIHERLLERFPEDLIKEREGAKGRVFKYVDARDVAERLDEAVGPQNWSFVPDVVDTETCAVRGLLTIHGVAKGDVGYPNSGTDAEDPNKEPLKAATSDALKRSAVLWGVGRHLYRDGKTGDQYGATGAAKAGRGKPALLSPKQKNYLQSLLDQNGFPIPDFLGELTSKEASTWIEELNNAGADAKLVRETTGEKIDSSEHEQPSQATEQAYRSDFAKASPDKPASGNQLATIAKLSRLLGGEEPSGDMTSAEASDRITELSREYNERKGTTRRSG